METAVQTTELDPIKRLTRDLKTAARKLTDTQARYLVDNYYQLQEVRKASANQVAALTASNEPCEVITWFRDNSETLEGQIKRALQAYAEESRIGRWTLSITGIGPVIAAGLLAHINMEPWKCVHVGQKLEIIDPETEKKKKQTMEACKPDAPHGPECHRIRLETVGHIYRFAGIDPTIVWEKGEKRPFNAALKVLTWKIGQSFLKNSSRENCFYGHLLLKRWEQEKQRNEQSLFADQAKAKLERFKIGKTTEAYKHYSSGHLPPAHILQRACRYSVKMFLSHFHHVSYVVKFGTEPPKPYVFVHQEGHGDYIAPYGWPIE